MTKILTFVVILDIALSSIASFAFATPTHVAAASDEPIFSVPDYALPALGIVFMVTVLYGWIGILFRWRFARESYLIAWAVSLSQFLFVGVIVQYPMLYLFSTLTALSGGFLICLIYFSEAKTLFNGAPNKVIDATP